MKKIHIILSVVFLLAVSVTLAACNKKPADENVVTDANGVAVTDAEGNTAYYAVTNADGEDITDADGNKIGALVTDKNGEPYTDKDGNFIYSAVTQVVTTKKDGQDVTVTKNDGSPVYEVVTKEDGDILYTTIVNEEGSTIFDGTYVDGENNIITTTKKKTTSSEKNNSSNKTTKKTTAERTTRTTTKKTGTTYNTNPTSNSATDLQAKLNYVKTIGGGGSSSVTDVVATSDGGYIAIATGNKAEGDFAGFNSNGNTSKFSCVIKYNAAGSKVWKTPVCGDKGVALDKVAVLKDGSIIAVGSTSSTNLGATPIGQLDNIIVKLSPAGKVQFTKLTGGKNHEYVKSVAATSDGGFIIGGKTLSTDGLFEGVDKTGAAFLIKYTKNGDMSWKKLFGGNMSDSIVDIAVTSDGNIYALCQTASSTGYFKDLAGKGGLDCVVIKLDKNGKELWKKSYSGSGHEEILAITATKDGGCVIGGGYTVKSTTDGSFSDFHNAGGFDSVLVKFNPSGSVAWQKVLAGFEDDRIFSVEKYGDGYVVVGSSKSDNRDFSAIKNMGDTDIFIWYVDSNGKTKALSRLGGSKSDLALGVTILSDGKSFVIGGHTRSSDSNLKGISPAGSDSVLVGLVAKYSF